MINRAAQLPFQHGVRLSYYSEKVSGQLMRSRSRQLIRNSVYTWVSDTFAYQSPHKKHVNASRNHEFKKGNY